MGKRSKIILGLLVAVLIGIIVTEIVRPRPINWSPSYTLASKIPFGCYVLYNELASIFPHNDIETVEENIYDVLVDRATSTAANYILINDFIYLDEQETNQLLKFVDEGNQVFIATSNLTGKLADTLNITIEQRYDIKEDSTKASFTNAHFNEEAFYFERGVNPAYLTSIDTAKTEILGHIHVKSSTLLNNTPNEIKISPNFIKTSFGKGNFIIN